MTDELRVRIVRVIEAPRERLFEAWLDPDVMSRFMKPAPGVTVHDVSVDAREGGEFSLVMRAGDTPISIRGRYLRVERFDRLELSWLSARTREDSRLALTFEALAPDRTRLTLSHVGFPSADSRNDHDGGWTQILEMLAGEAEGR